MIDKKVNGYRTSRGIERAAFQRHIRKIAAVMRHGCLELATVIDTLLHDWCKVTLPGLSQSEIGYCKEVAGLKEIANFVEWLSSKEILDAAYWLSSAYSIWMGGVYRKAYSMYFTPPGLVARMLDDLGENGVSFTSASFFDPACGGAAFLAPIAHRIKIELYKEGHCAADVLRHVESKVSGADIDATLCRMSKVFLRMMLAEEIVSEKYEPSFKIFCQNSLMCEQDGVVDVVICNPPYRKLFTTEAQAYRERYGEVIQNQANLYSLFVALCIRKVSDLGFVSLLTPTSYFSGKSFANLRKFVLSNTNVRRVGLIDQRSSVFIGVEQDTALALLQKSAKLVSHAVEIVSVNDEGGCSMIGRSSLPLSGNAWPLPRSATDLSMLQIAAQSSIRLKDYGYTPRIGAFVWNRDKRNTYSTLDEAIRAEAMAPVRLLWSSEIQAGQGINLDNLRNNLDEAAWVDLERAMHPSVIRNPAVVLQRVTSNDQPRRLVAAVVTPANDGPYNGFVGENHVVILEANCVTPKVCPDLLMSILLSNPVDRYFRCISGATNVSIYELEQLPLPCPRHVLVQLKGGVGVDEAVRLAYSSLESVKDVGLAKIPPALAT